MKNILIAAFLLMSICTYSQDKIRTVSGEIIMVRVLEINKEEVKYKKYSNLNGPIYIIRKQEISEITYQNGETEIFNDNEVYNDNEKPINQPVDRNIVALFNSMTQRNNRVYILSENENAIVHATNAINRWGYWVVTERKYNSDFILNFNIYFEGAEAYGNADFINPKNGKKIRSTNEFRVSPTWDLNVKRGLVNAIIEDGIKPMFY